MKCEEYRQFIEEYEKFCQNYQKAKYYFVSMKTLEGGGNTEQPAFLYQQAVEAHQDATNGYIQLVAMYRILIQKWLEANEARL
jgi:hypothetical protein